MRRDAMIFAVVLVAFAACYEPPDYRQTHFACKRSSLCPDGLTCFEDHCVVPSNDMVLVDHDPPFLIDRDEVRGLPVDAGDAYCRAQGMRLPSDDEWISAELAGVARGDGVRCVRTLD